jgi:hypothetical protein
MIRKRPDERGGSRTLENLGKLGLFNGREPKIAGEKVLQRDEKIVRPKEARVHIIDWKTRPRSRGTRMMLIAHRDDVKLEER